LTDPAVGINELSFPKGSSKLFFYSLTNGECCTRSIYEYNITSKQFKELEVTNYFPESRKYYLSPNGRKFASVISRQKASSSGDSFDQKSLYIIDLSTDSVMKAVTLIKANETLTQSCTIGCREDIRWLDDNTIKYGVFDLNSRYPDQKDLIEKRIIKIE